MRHEEATIRSFVVRHKQARYLGCVSNFKTRTRLTHALAHFRAIDPLCKFSIPPSRQNPREITRILTAKGAPGICYLISEHPDWDGREFSLPEALSRVVGSGLGTILSCIPGRLALIETEVDRAILEKSKKPLRPPQRIRFVVSNIDPDSGVHQGIFQAAYRLRNDWQTPEHDREELRNLLDWFADCLPAPDVLDDPRNRRAICWFKSESWECIRNVWAMVRILEENGVIVRKIKTGYPGHVLYEDPDQIVATPFGNV